MKHYQCQAEECSDDTIYRYKGLCRSCTSYDDSGNIITPVNRIQVNKDGSTYHKIVMETIGIEPFLVKTTYFCLYTEHDLTKYHTVFLACKK